MRNWLYVEQRRAESRERSRRRQADPVRNAAQNAQKRERYHAMSGPEYHRRLLQIRRQKALRRRAEREQRRVSATL